MRKLTDEVDLGAERVGSLLVSNLPLLYPGNGDVTHQEDSDWLPVSLHTDFTE